MCTGVPTIDAYQQHGSATATMIVVMVRMNRQIIANQKEGHALETCSPVTMATVFLESTFAMAITIVWTIQTKIRAINAVSIFLTFVIFGITHP